MRAEPTAFVVDDDPSMRSCISLLLRQVGIAVETFADADAFADLRVEDCLRSASDSASHLFGGDGSEIAKALRERSGCTVRNVRP